MFEKLSWYNKLPNEKMEVSEPHLRLFFETMYERQLIWKRRFIDKKERPWTENKIFQQSKFTNVYRELDKNSQWQIKNILLDDKLSLKNLIWKMLVFRTFNNPNTFKLGMSLMHWRNGIPDWEDYNEEVYSDFITRIRKDGNNPFTNAYIINSHPAPKKTRDYCYTKIVIPFIHKNVSKIIAKVLSAKTPEDIVKYLKTIPTSGEFISHEYYQDFTYISRYTSRKFMKFDQNDFTNVGPGASIGIRIIFPSIPTARKQLVGIYNLRDLAPEWLGKISKEHGEDMAYLEWNKTRGEYEITNKCNITLHQIEMWLCEFQKYWKMVIGLGKQRSNFIPTSKTIIKK